MKKILSPLFLARRTVIIAHLFTLLLFSAASVCAQSAPDVSDQMQRRVARARALTAAHNLAAAATELDAIRSAATDSSIKDVARILLMGIYLEQGDYTRAGLLLDDTYRARVAQDESSTRSYFALAGQAVNGARAHLGRYREFGISAADKGLPPEAVNDLDRLRLLLERIADQSKNISSEEAKSNDAVALLEDVAGVRGSLARDDRERAQWQREFTDARQKLAASETRIATLRNAPNRSTNSTAGSTSDSSSSGSNVVGATSNVRSSVNRAGAPTAKTSDKNSPARSVVASPAASAKPAKTLAKTATTQKAVAGVDAGAPPEVGSLLDKATQRVSPTYPPVAKSARVAGVVTVYLVIDESGTVASIPRVNGPQLLRQAAQEAARRWRFRPTLIDGQPARVTGFISFNFAL